MQNIQNLPNHKPLIYKGLEGVKNRKIVIKGIFGHDL